MRFGLSIYQRPSRIPAPPRPLLPAVILSLMIGSGTILLNQWSLDNELKDGILVAGNKHEDKTFAAVPATAMGPKPAREHDADFNTPHPATGYAPPSIEKENNVAQADPPTIRATPEEHWEQVKVKRGDNLALIFKRQKLSPRTLDSIMALGENTAALKLIKPGQDIRFLLEDSQLLALQYDTSLTDTLYIKKTGDDIYAARIVKNAPQVKTRTAGNVIHNSLFIAGKNAGLSDNIIMQMIDIYSWDIDFALEVRAGDKFSVVYEELYKEGQKIGDGAILAAEFINRGDPLRALRYADANGHTDYYDGDGNSMRKYFLRTPVEFTRISSHFNLKRRHPVLNKIRAHRGVDYAAPTGTPVRSTAKGVVQFIGNKGGYGKTVIIRHGNKYSTLYGHLSRFSRGVGKGQNITQGQTIGYVGMSGLATGPHLHYEFRVDGRHRNPLKVVLPKADRIPARSMERFAMQTAPLLAQLDSYTADNKMTADNPDKRDAKTFIAANEKEYQSSSNN